MNLTPQAMAKKVAATGFGVEPLEKVFRLMALLDGLGSHPFLKPRIALKGGTALNLFHIRGAAPFGGHRPELHRRRRARDDARREAEGRAGGAGSVLARGLRAVHQARPDRPRRRQVAADLRRDEGLARQPRAGRQLHGAKAPFNAVAVWRTRFRTKAGAISQSRVARAHWFAPSAPGSKVPPTEKARRLESELHWRGRLSLPTRPTGRSRLLSAADGDEVDAQA
jgi:hypothetical protein